MRITSLLCLSLLLVSCGSKSNKSTTEEIAEELPIIPDTVTLLFAGDIMQHLPQINAAKTETGYNYDNCFTHVKEDIQSVDLAIANLETTLAGAPYTGYPQFSAPDEIAVAIKKAGFNVLLTANNHTMDRYGKGLVRTLDVLDSLKIPHLGSYRTEEERETLHPLFITVKGMKLALLNYTYGTNGIPFHSPHVVNLIDTTAIKKDIQVAKNKLSDAIIVCIHWGDEYVTSPNKSQKNLASWLIGQGVDHIIGSHPHVVQPIKQIDNPEKETQHIVAYSLGNYISNMSREGTDGGLMVKLKMYKENEKLNTEASYSLVWVARPWLTGEKKYTILPINFPEEKLNTNSYNRLILFKKQAERVLKENDKEIKEYFL